MKRLVLVLSALLSLTTAAYGLEATESVVADTLQYKILYHWGFINKIAGEANLEVKVEGDTLTASLKGHSIPWGGRVYQIADTLNAVFTPSQTSDSLARESVRHINGVYTKPLVSVNPVSDEGPTPFKNIHGDGTLNASPATMEAVTITARMLDLFYYAKTTDFPSLTPGTTYSFEAVNSDGSVDTATMTYNGETTFMPPVEGLVGTSPAYNVTVVYAYEGSATKYPITVYIDRDSRHILSIAANIAIGHVEMIVE